MCGVRLHCYTRGEIFRALLFVQWYCVWCGELHRTYTYVLKVLIGVLDLGSKAYSALIKTPHTTKGGPHRPPAIKTISHQIIIVDLSMVWYFLFSCFCPWFWLYTSAGWYNGHSSSTIPLAIHIVHSKGDWLCVFIDHSPPVYFIPWITIAKREQLRFTQFIARSYI